MTTTTITLAPAGTTSKGMLWTGRVLTALIVLMMAGGSTGMLLFAPGEIAKGMQKYGYPDYAGTAINLVMIACAVIYAIPRTAVLGAILLTGYLGGATATHVRVGEPFFIPVLVGVVVWLGIYFRDARVRALVPLRKLR